MRKYRLLEEAERGCVIGDGRDQIAALCERSRNQAQWYAVRWKRLHEYLKDNADEQIFNECCAIMANGTASTTEPPTYDQMMSRMSAAIDYALAMSDTGSREFRSQFGPYQSDNQTAGWRVVEAIRNILVEASMLTDETKTTIETARRDARCVGSGELRKLCDVVEQSDFEIGKLTKIMRYVAANTRDSWARDYLVGRLIDRGHDAELTDPVQTTICSDYPICPDCGCEYSPIKRDFETIDCDCGTSFEARRCTVSRPFESK